MVCTTRTKPALRRKLIDASVDRLNLGSGGDDAVNAAPHEGTSSLLPRGAFQSADLRCSTDTVHPRRSRRTKIPRFVVSGSFVTLWVAVAGMNLSSRRGRRGVCGSDRATTRSGRAVEERPQACCRYTPTKPREDNVSRKRCCSAAFASTEADSPFSARRRLIVACGTAVGHQRFATRFVTTVRPDRRPNDFELEETTASCGELDKVMDRHEPITDLIKPAEPVDQMAGPSRREAEDRARCRRVLFRAVVEPYRSKAIRPVRARSASQSFISGATIVPDEGMLQIQKAKVSGVRRINLTGTNDVRDAVAAAAWRWRVPGRLLRVSLLKRACTCWPRRIPTCARSPRV